MTKLKLFHSSIIFLLLSTIVTIHGQDVDSNKCGGCPCNSPCVPSPPPPSPPPPKPKPPPSPSTNCPPPPSGGGGSGGGGGGGGGQYPPNPPYIYVNGPPGNLYPIDHYYSGSGREVVGFVPFLIIMISSGLWLLACV